MPRFILITDSPRHCHATHISRDEMVTLIRGPFGYSDVARCIEMIEAPLKMTEGARGYMPFPLHPAPWGTMSIHVEGLMDIQKERFGTPCEKCQAVGKPCAHRPEMVWMEAGHRCGMACVVGQATKPGIGGRAMVGGR